MNWVVCRLGLQTDKKLSKKELENPKRKGESESSLGAACVGGEARGIDAWVVGPVGFAALADIHAPLHHARALASSSFIGMSSSLD